MSVLFRFCRYDNEYAVFDIENLLKAMLELRDIIEFARDQNIYSVSVRKTIWGDKAEEPDEYVDVCAHSDHKVEYLHPFTLHVDIVWPEDFYLVNKQGNETYNFTIQDIRAIQKKEPVCLRPFS
ncbi:MAG: hypothetical protein QXS54_12185 [Candidatus Methanomethylicaceae archaeon]